MSFAALALRARAANDTTRAQINNIPEKSHVIPLLQSTAQVQEKKHLSSLNKYFMKVFSTGLCMLQMNFGALVKHKHKPS